MTSDIDKAIGEALDGRERGDALVARLDAIDAEREARAAPIFPDEDDLAMDVGTAAELTTGFRAVRDAHRGAIVVPCSILPAAPGRVAAAILVALDADLAHLTGSRSKARQRAAAEDFVDLQSFRPEEDAALLVAQAAPALDRADALERLTTARGAAITWIREDPTVVGSLNAIRGLDLRVGDARVALDAVNRYREHQALGFLTLIIGVPALIVLGIVVGVIVLALGS
jgi:hypothetical protein